MGGTAVPNYNCVDRPRGGKHKTFPVCGVAGSLCAVRPLIVHPQTQTAHTAETERKGVGGEGERAFFFAKKSCITGIYIFCVSYCV